MLTRSGRLDEKSSPVMVVAQIRCRNIAKSQELAKEKEFHVHQPYDTILAVETVGFIVRCSHSAPQRRPQQRRPPPPRYCQGSYRPPALPIFPLIGPGAAGKLFLQLLTKKCTTLAGP